MTVPRPITLATCQAENTIPISQALADFLSDRLKWPVHFLPDVRWEDAYAAITSGEIDLGWVCGWPYVDMVDKQHAPITLLAAPVPARDRYIDRPIYFSDVVVRLDSPAERFADLRGATWVYNEPGSHSGYHVVRYELARAGESTDFFGRVLASGAHTHSLDMILSGSADASAIDSTVLEWVLARRPELATLIKTIATLGPSPAPPLVASTALPPELRVRMRALLVGLAADMIGRDLLALGQLSRFAAVTDADYDPIRRMRAVAAGVRL